MKLPNLFVKVIIFITVIIVITLFVPPIINYQLPITKLAFAQTPTPTPKKIFWGTDPTTGDFVIRHGDDIKLRIEATSGNLIAPFKSSPSGDNLLLNGDFESDTNRDGFPDNWSIHFNDSCNGTSCTCTDCSATMETSYAFVNGGEKSMKLVSSANKKISIASEPFPVTPGTYFVASANVSGAYQYTTGFNFMIYFYSPDVTTPTFSNASQSYTLYNNQQTQSSYGSYSSNFYVPGGPNGCSNKPCTKAILALYSTADSSGGTRYIDNVVVKPRDISGILTAANVSSGQFGGNSGGGNFSFYPASQVVVGANSATGAYKLDVQGGNVNSANGFCIAGDCKTSWAAVTQGVISGSGTANYVPKFTDTAIIGNSLIYDNGTNIGIGTTGPTQKLEVAGSGLFTGTNLILRPSAAAAGTLIVDSGTTAVDTRLLLQNSGNTKWTFAEKNGDSDKLVISGTSGDFVTVMQTSGNVGIGTTGPVEKLQVAGAVKVTGTIAADTASAGAMGFQNSAYRFISWGSTGVKGAYSFEQYTPAGSGQIAMVIQADTGNVGIGTTGPLAKLHVEGQCVTGDTLLRRKRRRRRSDGTWEEYWEDVPIKDIEEGDEILTLDEKTQEFVTSKVKGLMDMGTKTTFKLITSDGKAIRTTAEHPYLVRSLGAVDTNFFHDLTYQTLENLGRKYYESALEGKEFGDILFSHEGFEHIVHEQKSKLNILSRILGLPKVMAVLENSTTFQKHDLKEIGKNKHDYWVYEQTIDGVKIQAVVRSVNGGHKHFYSVVWKGFDKKSVEGAVSGISHPPQRVVTLQRRVHDLIVAFIDEMSRSGIASPSVLKKFFKVEWVKVRFLKAGMEVGTYGKDNRLSWQKIEKIEKVGEEQVYDIEVESTHNFVGNGIVAHNTYLNGNTGIGVYPPTQKLDVAGGYIKSDTGLCIGGNCITNWNQASGYWTLSGSNLYPNSTAYNVGIGTTSPGYPLTVNGVSSITQNDASVYVPTTYGTHNNVIRVNNSATAALGVNSFIGFYGAGNVNSRFGVVQNASGVGDFVFNAFDGSVYGEKMRITSAGNVGIGTTGPGKTLDIAGTLRTTSNASFGGPIDQGGNGPNTFSGNWTGLGGGYYNYFKINPQYSDGSGGTLVGLNVDMTSANLTITNKYAATFLGGNVGIGTTAPTQKLDVAGGYIKSDTGLCIGGNCITNWNQASGYWTLSGSNLYPNSTAYNVGIGTTAPIGQLHILQSVASTPIVILENDTTTSYPFMEIRNAAAQANSLRMQVFGTAFTTAGSLVQSGGMVMADTNLTGGLSIETRAAAPIRFYTNGDANERMRIDSGGNVGIGTTAPSVLLHVDKSQNTDTYAYITNVNSGTAARAGLLVGESGSGLNYSAFYQPGSSYTTNGLEVANRAMLVGYDTAGMAIGSFNASAPLIFFTGDYSNAANERVRITSTGNVGIGTTSPSSSVKLDVAGNIGTTGKFYGTKLAIADNYTLGDSLIPAKAYSAYIKGDLGIGGHIIGSGADIAEKIPSIGTLEPGDVVVVYDDMKIKKSEKAYDKQVVGVVSSDPAMVMAEKRDGVAIAMTGTTPVKVTGKVTIGDLLTTSDTAGHAMVCEKTEKCEGSIIGKAMENFEGEKGKIMMLVMPR